MNRDSWTTPQHRFGCAVAAAVASTLVLTSVVWLFAGAAGPSASATPAHVLVTADGRDDAQWARLR